MVFSHQALPVIRPAYHLIEPNIDIIIRTRIGAALLVRAARPEVVAYEGDHFVPAPAPAGARASPAPPAP